MKKILFFLFFFLAISLFSNVKVNYTSSIQPEVIKTIKINNIEYFKISELNKVFQARISIDFTDQRLTLLMYNDTIIFLLETPYLIFKRKIYNFKHPIIIQNSKSYLPKSILFDIFPKIFKEFITVDNEKSITAYPPFDNSIKTIIIDPGHGGKDPGAIGISGNIFEKDITLKIAKKVKKYLEKKLGKINVILTREDDKFVSLKDRTTLANNLKADIFVSIHCNANRNHNVKGTEVYYLSTAKTNEARAVEALENSVVEKYEGGLQAVKKYDDLAFILADMSQNEHLEESFQLADILEEKITKYTGFIKRGVKQANFYVMRGAFMPAVLVETGFITNEEEEKLLNSNEYQDKIAKAIGESIIFFKKKHDLK